MSARSSIALTNITSVPLVAQPSSTYKEDRAFKYYGYPCFCEFVASENDFFLLRRFGKLNARVLLTLQQKITAIETELSQLDQVCMNHPDDSVRSDSFAYDEAPGSLDVQRFRATLVNNHLRPLLKEYNEYITAYAPIREKETARKYQVNNVRNWFDTYKNAVVPKEQEYINVESDLISIGSKMKPPLHLAVEKSRLLKWLFRKAPRPGQFSAEGVKFWSDKKMKGFSDALIILLGLLMLYGPMWWLNWVDNNPKRLGIITAFVTLFAVGLRMASEAKPFEVLAATAAYAAVLMVFMQRESSS